MKQENIIDEIEKAPGVSCLQAGIPEIEIWKTFPGVTFQQIKDGAQILENSYRLPVANLGDLRTWKEKQYRDKDISDLMQMEGLTAVAS